MKVFINGPYVEPYIWKMSDKELYAFIDDLAASRYQETKDLEVLSFSEDYFRTLLDDCGSHGLIVQSVEHEFLRYLNSAECRMQVGLGPTCRELRLVARRGGIEFRWGKFLYSGEYESGETRLVQKLALRCCKMHSITFSRNVGGIMWKSHEMQTASVRDTSSVKRVVRNTNPSRFVKELYGGQCQKCQMVLHSPNGPIAEAAHIIEVQSGGADDASNLFCLCPNCHKAFDANAWAPKLEGPDLLAISYDNSKENEAMILHAEHQVAHEAVDWRLKKFHAA